MQVATASIARAAAWVGVFCGMAWHSSVESLELPRLAAPPAQTPGAVVDIVMDAAGNMYVSGVVNSYKSTLVSSATYTNAGIGRVFVAKYAPLATTPSYVAIVGLPSYTRVTSTGHVEEEWAAGLAVDVSGNAYVVAYEGDLTYPITGGTHRENSGRKYVWKVSAAGNVSKLSKELDPAVNRIGAIAVDATGAIWLTGSAKAGFVTTTGAPYATSSTGPGCIGAYVAKLDPTGQNLLYATYLGNSGTAGQLCGGKVKDDQLAPQASYPTGFAMALDPTGNVYIAGQAAPGLAATPGALDLGTKVPSYGGWNNSILDIASHAFVTKLSPAGSLVWTARFGGNLRDRATSIVVDGSGSVVIAGKTTSTNLPLTGGAMESMPVTYMDCLLWTPEVGFIARLTPDGRQLVFAGYLSLAGKELDNCGGGAYAAPPARLALDPAGNVYATGFTEFSNRSFSSIPPRIIPEHSESGNSILQIYSADGRQKHFSSALPDGGSAVAVDLRGNVVVGGFKLTYLSPLTWPLEITPPTTYSCVNKAFTLSAKVAATPDGGAVDFMSDGALIGSAPLVGGVATRSFTIATVGVKRLKATYRGAGPFDTYASPEMLLGINQAGVCP